MAIMNSHTGREIEKESTYLPNLSNGRVLIVDDDPEMRHSLADALSSEGYETTTAIDGQAALETLGALSPDVIVTDLVMPRLDGFELLRTLRESGQPIPTIVLTGFGSLEKALSIVRDLEAYWFLEKPVEVGALRSLLQRAIQHSRLLRQTETLKRDLALRGALGRLVGSSRAMQEVFSLVRLASPSSVSILLSGESGTGKELAAREIHNLSQRADQPFVAVNCAALPETLIDSELFGHEKGAFTGAFERRLGCFEQAHGGTLFLDEITEMPLASQSKLLRALEERQIRRLGGKAEIPVDVRLIAATNRQPEEALRNNTMREDLYYRLNVFQIRLPALRERLDDVAILAESMIPILNDKHGTSVTSVEPAIMTYFREYQWPGNVRELRNVIERAAILAGSGPIQMRHVRLQNSNGSALAVTEVSSDTTRERDSQESSRESITLRPGIQLIGSRKSGNVAALPPLPRRVSQPSLAKASIRPFRPASSVEGTIPFGSIAQSPRTVSAHLYAYMPTRSRFARTGQTRRCFVQHFAR